MREGNSSDYYISMDISSLGVPWRPTGWWGRTAPTENKKKISSLFDVGCCPVVLLLVSGNEEFLEGRREMGMFMMKSLGRDRERERSSKC